MASSSEWRVASGEWRVVTAIFLVLVSIGSSALAIEQDPNSVAANRVVELTFEADNPVADAFNTIDVDVTFTTPSGKVIRVPAFWAGGTTWRVRYASPDIGVHTYVSSCTRPDVKGLHQVSGKVQVVRYRGENFLYRHGPIRVAPDQRHFAYADGEPFFWLGDTWWMGLCERLKWPEEFQTLAEDRKAKGFTVIQVVAGLYPDMPAFDPRGKNEAGFPWTDDYSRIRPEYFDQADRRLNALVDHGLAPCVVMAWGYHLPWLGAEKMKQHVRYVMARYGALPVIWCMAGEVNLPYYLEKGFPRGGEKQTAGWEGIIKQARGWNGFGRLMTVHPTGIQPLSGRLLYKDQTLFDFDMLQTGHGQREVLAPTIRALRTSYAARPTMPVVNGEVSYEALSGTIPAEIPRLMFWTCMLSGAAGHTYGANGIWQLNRRDQPYGKSPHGGTYGPIPWDDAMRLPGSRQIGLGKQFLERYAWWRFEPHPEWAEWAPEPAPEPKPTAARNEFEVPYTAVIPGELRITYAPRPRPVRILSLEPGRSYTAAVFNPATGELSELGAAYADPSGTWTAKPPAGLGSDWVVVLKQ